MSKSFIAATTVHSGVGISFLNLDIRYLLVCPTVAKFCGGLVSGVRNASENQRCDSGISPGNCDWQANRVRQIDTENL
jgi:hypothetical protein